MILSDVSVRRPVFAAVVALLIFTFGVISFFSLPLREFPDVDTPIVSVQTDYVGASAAVIESRITQLIEDRISGISGIRSITSTSRDNRSDINIEFDAGRSIEEAANDVRDRVGRLADDLPDGAELPQINKVEADAQPVIWIAVTSGQLSRMAITDYAERFIVDRFSAINGIARVQMGGALRPSMRIWLDRQKLAAHQLGPADIATELRRQNVELPAGRIESAKMNMTLRLNRAYSTPEQFRALPVARGENGHVVRLGDVATVELGPENPYSMFRGNGHSMVVMGMVRQSSANLLEIAHDVRATIAATEKGLPPGMKLTVQYDTSMFVQASIDAVYQTLGEAAVLVVLVIFLFLGSARATLIPAVTVPVSLIGTFIALGLLGYSINLLTLLALVLAIGLVVDDAIVVLENIHHRIEQGEPPLLASYNGARQVGFAVLATTMVVVAVFVPLFFAGGLVGRLLTELAAAMIAAVVISLFLSLTLTPAMASKFLRRVETRGRLNRWVDDRFAHVSAFYRTSLERAIDRPMIAAGVTAGALAIMAGSTLLLPHELVPEEDSGVCYFSVSLPEGTGYDHAVKAMIKVEVEGFKVLHETDSPIRRMFVRVPAQLGSISDFSTGNISFFLKDWRDRDISTQDLVQNLSRAFEQVPDIRAFGTVRGMLGGNRGRPVQFVLAGESFEQLARARDRLVTAAESYPGLVGLDADYKETQPQLLIDIDVNRAADLGVSAQAIGETLETMLGSRRVSTFLSNGEEYYVMLQAQRADRLSQDDLANTYVRSQTSGRLISMSNLVHTRERADAGTLGRYNKMRAITLQANLAPGTKLGEALDFLEQTVTSGSYPEVRMIGYKGDSREFRDAGSSLLVILGFAVVIIFLVLAAQFESFVHPLTIILTVPLAIAGGLVGMVLMGVSINVFSQVGIIMLVGLATKNGILIVEFANQLRDTGLSVREAVVAASERRLRPIAMTSIATVAGAVPLMLARGPGSGFREAIGVVVVFGVSVASVFTLLVIPTVYARLARYTRSPESVARELADQQAGSGNHSQV